MSQKAQTIPFYEPYMTGNEIPYLEKSLASGKIVGNAGYTRKCEQLLEETFNAKKILLTNSCTAALEMASILIDLQPGDEIIVPSFTFVSTVNAFMLRGAKPVFVDIRGDKVRLGIDAPVDIPVHRQEVFDALQRKETRQADESSTDENITN